MEAATEARAKARRDLKEAVKRKADARKQADQRVKFDKVAYTIRELVERGLGCKVTLHNLIRRGELRAVKRGYRTLILAPDLEAWLAAMPTIAPRRAPTE